MNLIRFSSWVLKALAIYWLVQAWNDKADMLRAIALALDDWAGLQYRPDHY
jgi:hypothetical protein